MPTIQDRTAEQQPGQLYYGRMATALNDKAALLSWLAPGTVADLGCANGKLTHRIAAHPDVELVYGYDLNSDAIVRALSHEKGRAPGAAPIRWRNGDASWLAQDLPALGEKGGFDDVMLCSVMHEVHSYAPADRQANFAAFHETIDLAVEALAPGGRLLVRDGVMPNRPDDQTMLVAPHMRAVALVERYLELVPFEGLKQVTRFSKNARTCSRSTAAEILLTVNWGEQSLPRESQERYMLATLDGYADLVVHDRPLVLLHSESYVQPGYTEHLAVPPNRWVLSEGNATSWFPDTNAIWVFEKAR